MAAPDLDSLWDFGDPSGSETRFRDALAAAPAEAPAFRAEILSQIARCQGLQHQFEVGHATVDAAEALLGGAALPGPIDEAFARPRTRLLLERGRLLNSGGSPDQALPLFEQAWEVARGNDLDGLAVDAAHMCAIAGEGAARGEWNARALELAAASRDPTARRWRASLLNNVGWDLHDDGHFEAALSRFEEALELREAAGTPDPIAVAKWCVARALRSLGRLDEALEIQERLLEERGEDATGYVHEELGELYLALGRGQEARRQFGSAAARLRADKWFVESNAERLARIERLAAAPE